MTTNLGPVHIPGFTSTGSKRPDILFDAETADLPLRLHRTHGCTVWDEHGRSYVDYIMALGAVSLGYAHPDVVVAAKQAIDNGGVGPLAPVLEEEVAAALSAIMPAMERIRFLKSGAEAMAAAVRIARVATGRERVLGCGYHGWLDWCQSAAGVPASTRALYGELPFNDAEATRAAIRAVGSELAAVVFEPLIMREPSAEWLEVLATETRAAGALLVIDEIKTACRLAPGGAMERYDIQPDLVVVGKAIANGFPLAAVGGRADAMAFATRTWISSTLATEFVSLAAAQATLAVVVRERVPAYLGRVGASLFAGLHWLRERHPKSIASVAGVPAMCCFEFTSDETGAAFARACAARGLLFKRSAYNFVSLAHDDTVVDRTLEILDDALKSLR